MIKPCLKTPSWAREGHEHDSLYLTPAEADALLEEKADAEHTHEGIGCEILVGTIVLWAGQTEPVTGGWQVCNGDAIKRDDFPTLFATIGTTYGDGDGSTTFNLPDMRGRFPIHAKPGRDAIGDVGGSEEHTLSVNEIPSHRHSMKKKLQTANATWGTSGGNRHWFHTTNGDEWNNYTGGGAPHNNLPPYIALSFGIFSGAKGT